MQIRKGFIFENNENLRQLEEVMKLSPTYLISSFNYKNHAFNVIKYYSFFIFNLILNIQPTASSRLDIEYRISNNEPAANFTHITHSHTLYY